MGWGSRKPPATSSPGSCGGSCPPAASQRDGPGPFLTSGVCSSAPAASNFLLAPKKKRRRAASQSTPSRDSASRRVGRLIILRSGGKSPVKKGDKGRWEPPGSGAKRGEGSRLPASEPAMRVPGCACSAGEGRRKRRRRRRRREEGGWNRSPRVGAARREPGRPHPGGGAGPRRCPARGKQPLGDTESSGVRGDNRGHPPLHPLRTVPASRSLPPPLRCEVDPGPRPHPGARGGQRSTTHRGGSDMMGRLIYPIEAAGGIQVGGI